MTEKLYVRAICPNDIKPRQLVDRNFSTNYAPWYIGHEQDEALSTERLDELFEEWLGEVDWDRREAMCEFEDFSEFLERNGYTRFFTSDNIWMPKEEE